MKQVTIYWDSLGCAKNLVDSELAIGLLKEAGFALVEDPGQAEVIIVNTCGFINDAKEESIQDILTLAQYKEAGKCRLLVATGCLVQKYRQELAAELPELDLLLGTQDYLTLVNAIKERLGMPTAPNTVQEFSGCFATRSLLTPPYTAYLKIAEGCSNHCSFCVIPEMRGELHSRSIEDIVAEAEWLQKRGVKELVLIAQDTTAYGLDRYHRPMLAELLERVSVLDIPWLRVLYCYPDRLDETLLSTMAKLSNVCPYLDIPLQHISKPVLKKMGRSYDQAQVEALLAKIKQYLPDVAIRTTFMVGFPGETEEDFAELLDFAKSQPFAWAGVFMYSQEEGTPAANMSDQIPEDVKVKRYNQLTAILAMQGSSQRETWLGKTLPVLLEGVDQDYEGYWLGRSPYHAPSVDGLVYIEDKNGLLNFSDIGKICHVKIHTVDTYDVIGTLV